MKKLEKVMEILFEIISFVWNDVEKICLILTTYKAFKKHDTCEKCGQKEKKSPKRTKRKK